MACRWKGREGMKSRQRLTVLAVALLGSILTGCNFLAPVTPSAPDMNAVGTAAAATVQAIATQSARTGSTPIDLVPTQAPPTTSPPGTQGLPPSFTPVTLPASITPTSGSTCDRAEFVTDVQVKDGDAFAPNTAFTKIWRLKNVGTCTWSSGYSVVYAMGDRMSGPESFALGATVEPGHMIDLSIALRAPASAGTYQGYWQFRNTSGATFGIGPAGVNPFWVAIKVSSAGSTGSGGGLTRTPTPKPVTKIVYDFVKEYCDADWSTGSGDLSCPGSEGDEDGFVVKLTEPVLEGGRKENESALWTEPEHTDGGRISGVFPSFDVKTGDRFRAVIGCLDSAEDCDVQFKLQYQIGSGDSKTLEDWSEEHDGEFQKIDLDLSSLAGKKVKFILTVKEAGDYDEPAAFWLSPRLMR